MSYLNVVLRHRYVTVCFLLLVVCLATAGARKLEFVSDIRVFFSSDNPELKNLNTYERAFAKKEALLFIVVPDNKDIFTIDTLLAIEELTKNAWELPTSSRVNSVTNFSHTYAEGDELIVKDLVPDPATLTPADLQRIKEFALSEPMLLRTLVAPAGDVAVIAVTTQIPEGETGVTTHLTSMAKVLAKQVDQKYPNLHVLVSGDEIFNAAFSEVSRNDMLTLYPLMIVVMIVLMFIMLRSISGIISTILILFTSAGTAMGLAGYFGVQLTSVSAAAPIVILTLAVSDSIHIIVSMAYFMAKGKTKDDAIFAAIELNLSPIFITSLTTAIGFLSMLTSDSPPFQDLGLIVAMGVVAAYVFSMVLLPALLSILPFHVPRGETSKEAFGIPFVDATADFILGNRKLCFGFVSFVLLVLAAGIPRIELYDKFIEYFDTRYEVRRVADFLEDRMSGLAKVKYLMASGEEGGINEPEFLQTVDNFSNWCLEQPEVVKVSSYVHTIKRLNKNMHGDDQSFYRIPEERNLAAQYLLLYEMSLPFGQNLDNVLTPDRSALSVEVLVTRLSTLEFTNFEEKAAIWLATNAPPNMRAPATGVTSMFAHISERNIKSMLTSTTIALFAISLTLIFAFRSLKFGLFSLIPNLIPAVMTLGMWGLLVGNVNMAVSFIAAMSLGVVVDDTVHFLSKYLHARRSLNKSPTEAIRFAFHTVGMALVTTSLILAAGFFVLYFSGFELNSTMGILMSVSIMFALIADVFFLPLLVLFIDQDDKAIP